MCGKEANEIMEKILIIFLVLFLILLICTVRKIYIISDLENKLLEHQNMNNMYVKVQSNKSSLTSFEKYYKDGVEKDVITAKKRNAVITQYIYANQRKVFTDSSENKTLEIYNENYENVYAPILVSYTSVYTVQELIYNGIFNRITTENLEGKECYVLNSRYSPHYIYDKNSKGTKIYIEKDTGLTIKVVETLENDEQAIINYEYSFGTVTDNDMKEPDNNLYLIK